MKTLAIAIIALASVAGSAAFAKDAPTQDTSAKTPPSSTSLKSWAVGDRIAGASVLRKYAVANPDQYQLPEAPFHHRWVVVDGAAYLVDQDSLRVRKVIPVQPK